MRGSEPQLTLTLDSVLSMTFGRPLMLQLKSSTPLPEVVDEEFLTTTADADNGTQPPEIPAKCAFFVSTIKLSHITAEILRSVHIGSCTEDGQSRGYNR